MAYRCLFNADSGIGLSVSEYSTMRAYIQCMYSCTWQREHSQCEDFCQFGRTPFGIVASFNDNSTPSVFTRVSARESLRRFLVILDMYMYVIGIVSVSFNRNSTTVSMLCTRQRIYWRSRIVVGRGSISILDKKWTSLDNAAVIYSPEHMWSLNILMGCSAAHPYYIIYIGTSPYLICWGSICRWERR